MSCVRTFGGRLGVVNGCLSKRPRGRPRFNGLAALNAVSHEVFSVKTLPNMTATTVWELLSL
jgi:hypothetical protein